MNHFQLTDALMTGHAGIDAEHAHLVALLNELMDLSEAGDDNGCAGKISEFTEALTSHLESEEKIMAELKCYDLENHKEIHLRAIKKYERLITDAEHNGYDNDFVRELASLLLDDCIRGDMMLKSYLQVIDYQG